MNAASDDRPASMGCQDEQRPPTSLPPARRTWAGWLFLGVLALYLFTAAGQFQTVDAAQELGVAVSLRHGNGVRSDFPVGAGGGTTVGRDGHRYAGHDIGSSLLYLPYTLIPGTAEHRVTTTRTDDSQPRALVPNQRLYFAASFLAPLLGALIVLVFALLLAELGFDPTTVVVTASALAFATTVWVYAHVSFDSTATSLAAVAAVWCAVRFLRQGTPRDALATGACLAAGVLVRVDTLVMVPFLALPVLIGAYRQWKQKVARPIASIVAVAAPVTGAFAAALVYNWYRFGSITDNGHTDDGFLAFNPRLGEGLFGQIASPGKGLLVFSPLLIVALFRWRWFLKRHAVIAGSVAGATIATLLAHAAIVGWAGDQAWGARFTVVVVPLVAIPLARVVQEIRDHRIGTAGRVATGAAAVVGFVIQVSGVFVDFFAVVVARRLRGEDTATSLTHAAYVDGLGVLWRAVTHAQPYADLTPAWIASLQVARLDVWWVRAAQVSGWNPFTVCIPLVLLGLACWAGLRLRRVVFDPATR
ncbi:MAG TPA: hypothetical protein VFN21_10725 [Acidimicrobiales bacterium]|nr:hypothetical protein [Acidimicrobiales bacterium]